MCEDHDNHVRQISLTTVLNIRESKSNNNIYNQSLKKSVAMWVGHDIKSPIRLQATDIFILLSYKLKFSVWASTIQ